MLSSTNICKGLLGSNLGTISGLQSAIHLLGILYYTSLLHYSDSASGSSGCSPENTGSQPEFLFKCKLISLFKIYVESEQNLSCFFYP